jgi:hypothetical protein
LIVSFTGRSKHVVLWVGPSPFALVEIDQPVPVKFVPGRPEAYPQTILLPVKIIYLYGKIYLFARKCPIKT